MRLVEAVRPIRVAVLADDGVLEDVIRRSLETEPDIHVIALDSARPVAADLQTAHAQVVVWAHEARPSGDALRNLLSYPGLGVVAIEDRGRGASIYTLRPHRVPLGDLSPDRLADAVRAAARSAP